MAGTTRATIYFDETLHRALQIKAADTHRSVSELVNVAVRTALREDAQDLAAFAERAGEPMITYEELLRELKL